MGGLLFDPFFSLLLLSLKKESLRLIDRRRSEIDVLRDEDFAGIGGVVSVAFSDGVESVPFLDGADSISLIGGIDSTPILDGINSTSLADDVEPTPSAIKVDPASLAVDVDTLPLFDGTDSTPLVDAVESIPLVDVVKSTALAGHNGSTPLTEGIGSTSLAGDSGSTPLAEDTDSVALTDGVEFGLLIGVDRSELVTRITGSTLFAAIACSKYGDEGSLRLELLPDVFTLKFEVFWGPIGRMVVSGASGRGLCGDLGGVKE